MKLFAQRLSAAFLALVLMAGMYTPAMAWADEVGDEARTENLSLTQVSGEDDFIYDFTSVTVYITKSGTKYHRETCSSLSKSKIPIDLDDALARGYVQCSNCRPQSCSHANTAWRIVDQATCENAGSEEQCCSSCGAVVGRRGISAKGHALSWVTLDAATCQEPGSRIEQCSVCWSTLRTEPLPKLSHASKWEILSEATNDKTGQATNVCTMCLDVIDSKVLTTVFGELSGADRIETSLAIARESYPKGPKGLILVRSDSFPDALAASSLAGQKSYPIVSCSTMALAPSVEQYLRQNTSIEHVVIVGGQGSISDAVEADVKGIVVNVERIAGNDRYETAALLRQAAALSGASSSVAVVARGDDFPDALSISPYCAESQSPMYLLPKNSGPDAGMVAELRNYEEVVIVGGYGSVSGDVEASLSGSDVLVTRLAGGMGNSFGANRYGTSAAIADWLVRMADFSYDKAAFATGKNYPDALAGAPLCGSNAAPLLLIDPDSLDTADLVASSEACKNAYWLGSVSTLDNQLRMSAKVLIG